ncbi:MAG TPA: pseudouridine synthase [Candidatus Saccharimonadales bacterium]|nr:pseudouridine synthase [Candidatus Saccharimonadales bacterium]
MSAGSKAIFFEDEHLLVIHKPAGVNTHAPSPYAGEGIYDWLRHREPRWATLSILHRLDKETSGVMVFGKTPEANRALTRQFTEHSIRKSYLLVTDRLVPREEMVVVSYIARAGAKYVSRSRGEISDRAETRLKVVDVQNGLTTVRAEPITGRTHQIRVHAAENGFPIRGDVLYGGTAAERLYLHAEELRLQHPANSQAMVFRIEADFERESSKMLRELLVDPKETDAYRLMHGAADRFPGLYVDKIGEFLLAQSSEQLGAEEGKAVENLGQGTDGVRGVYHKHLSRHLRQSNVKQTGPQHRSGEAAPDRFSIRENGILYEVSFSEGYSVGLFFDQRDNRRRMLTGHIAAGFPMFEKDPKQAAVLNTFAYTCGFSVCAAKSGARVTSLDLSKKYLEWGKRNFLLNQLDPSEHDFIYGDVFDWLRRMTKKGRLFDAVVLDPPTFSHSKEHGTFQAERDFGKLVTAAIAVLGKGGILLASSNTSTLEPEKFVQSIEQAIKGSGRNILQSHYVPQPLDFRITREEPAYLKTLWLKIQ